MERTGSGLTHPDPQSFESNKSEAKKMSTPLFPVPFTGLWIFFYTQNMRQREARTGVTEGGGATASSPSHMPASAVNHEASAPFFIASDIKQTDELKVI